VRTISGTPAVDTNCAKATRDETKVTEKGYYVRVWKRHGARDRWKLVLDTTHPLPPAEK
jgi:hypothetical protein